MDAPAWQRGYPLERLRALAAPLRESLEPFCFGAFGLPKERDIAAALAEERCSWKSWPNGSPSSVALWKLLAQGSVQHDFTGREVRFPAGTLLVKAIGGETMRELGRGLAERHGGPVVFEIPQESRAHRELAEELGCKPLAVKVAASSDLRGLWALRFEGAEIAPLAPSDEPGLVLLDAQAASPEKCEAHALEAALVAGYEQHYSSYNLRQSWSAFALRGFDPDDPGFIIKPAEMSRRWKQEHPERLYAWCDWTEAAYELRDLCALAVGIGERWGCGLERVRLMQLDPEKGELSRHADITDRAAGTRPGQIARLHLPLQTGEGCSFYSWTLEGERLERHFPTGSLFYLDVRKPHAVRNAASCSRIHLVVDCIATDALASAIAEAGRGA